MILKCLTNKVVVVGLMGATSEVLILNVKVGFCICKGGGRGPV